MPRYVPPGEIARGLPRDSHCAIDVEHARDRHVRGAAEAVLTSRADVASDAPRGPAQAGERERVQRRALALALAARQRVALEVAELAREHHVALDELTLGAAVQVTGRRDRRGRRGVGGRRRSLRDCGEVDAATAHEAQTAPRVLRRIRLCCPSTAQRRHATCARRRWPVVCHGAGARRTPCTHPLERGTLAARTERLFGSGANKRNAGHRRGKPGVHNEGVNVTLPDGTELALADGATGADAAAAIGPGLARAALAVRQNGEVRDLARPLVAGAPLEIITARSPGRAGRHPPRRRARARRGGHGALSGREDLDRAADRERLLLRLRVPRGRHGLRRGLRPHRAEDAPAHQRRRAVRPRGRQRRGGARALQGRGAGLQGRAHRGPRDERRSRRAADHGQPLHERPLHRPLPRPARPGHEAHQGRQAAVRRGRLLARRRRPPAAHPHLRHGVLLQGGARRAPRAPRAGPRPRPPQARQGARAVHVLRAVAGLAVLAAGRDGDLERAVQALARGEPRPRLPRGQDADPLRRRPVQAVRPLGHVPREHVLHRRRGPADGPQADELPGPHPDLQGRPALLPRPTGALLRAGSRPPPRAQRHAARAHARAPHHAGRRPHLLQRGADPRGGHRLPGLRLLPL